MRRIGFYQRLNAVVITTNEMFPAGVKPGMTFIRLLNDGHHFMLSNGGKLSDIASRFFFFRDKLVQTVKGRILTFGGKCNEVSRLQRAFHAHHGNAQIQRDVQC